MSPPEGGARCSVVVLSCGILGYLVAGRLGCLPEMSVTLVTTPYRRPRGGARAMLRRTLRNDGPAGLFDAVRRRTTRALGLGRREPPEIFPVLDARVAHLSFADFHDPACIDVLRSLAPDVGVLAGTYILGESVFGIPRLGTINLHSGKAPEYRGAAPAFWELYNGESEVGITVHEVVPEVDAGRVIRQEMFPLDPAPVGDPIAYVERFRKTVLEPNGLRLLVEGVRDVVSGAARPLAQDAALARTFPTPDHAAKRELIRRVAARRARASVSVGVGRPREVPVGRA